MRTSIQETKVAAQSLHMQTQLLEVKGPDEIDGAFDVAKKQRADALVQIEAALFAPHQQRIIELATKAQLPAVHNNRADVEIGGLMSYGPDRVDMNRRAAVYVDKILKGAKPADLPVQQATKFEFVINLKAAKQIGLTVPNRVLERATQVIR
jgi:putative ABC transport system substrate-binding protein